MKILTTGDHQFPAGHLYTCEPGYPWYTLELVTHGRMQRRSGVNGRFRDQAPYHPLLTPPDLPYSLRSRGTGYEIWAIFRPDQALIDSCLNWPIGEHGVGELPLPNRDATPFLEVHQRFTGSLSLGRALAENALERLLLLTASHYQQRQLPPVDARIQRALDILHAACAASHTVASLAARANLSPSRFAHLFKAETGETPMAALERIRLEQARQRLLRSTEPIKQLAAGVGYDDPNYFATRFRHRFGHSPSACRRGHS